MNISEDIPSVNELMDRFVKLAGSRSWMKREEAAYSDDCPAEILARLVGDKNSLVRRAVIRNRNCTPEMFVKLAGDEDFQVRWDVAKHKNCPREAFVRLADDNNFGVRNFVANNPSCPQEILVKLSTDENILIRRTVARNPKCPSAVLEKLASDEKDILDSIRAAKKKNCPPDVLEKLAENDDWGVCYAVAIHPNCPVEALVRLTRRNIDSAVWNAVVENPNCPEFLIRELAMGGYGRNLAAAKSKRCPADVLAMLADDIEPYVREMVAKNPNCPVEAFAKLAEDPDKEFRILLVVASNPSCPIEIMTQLAKSKNSSIREAVADNPNCPVEIRKIALERNHNSDATKSSVTQPLTLSKSLEPFRNRIESTIKPYVRMEVGDAFVEFHFKERLGLWQSKIGGFPYFPKGHDYPADCNGKPFHLLLQINFSDMPKLDLFPEKGILQVYIGKAKGYRYGVNHNDLLDRSHYRVLFFPEVIYDKDALITEFDFLPKNNSFLPSSNTIPIKFELKHAPIPSQDYRFSESFPDLNFDDNYKLFKLYQKTFGRSGSKIGGYPDYGQDIRALYQCSPDIKLHHGEWKQEADENELILLMQLDGSLEMTWEDRYAYIFIRKADLLMRDFSKVLYVWNDA